MGGQRATSTLPGAIEMGGPVANLCFDERHLARLFMAAGSHLFAIHLNVRKAALGTLA